MMPVLLRLDAMAMAEGITPEVRRDIAFIQSSMRHVNGLCDGLSLLSGGNANALETHVTSLSEWWTGMRALAVATLPPTVVIDTEDISSQLPVVRVPADIVSRILMTAITHVRQTWSDASNGHIALSARMEDDHVLLEILERSQERAGTSTFRGPSRPPATSTSMSELDAAFEECRSALEACGGRLEVFRETAPSRISVKAYMPVTEQTSSDPLRRLNRRVLLALSDPRQVALVQLVVPDHWERVTSSDTALVDVVVTDAAHLAAIQLQFREDAPRVIVLGAQGTPERNNVHYVDVRDVPRLSALLQR